jgi:polygalacturonase
MVCHSTDLRMAVMLNNFEKNIFKMISHKVFPLSLLLFLFIQGSGLILAQTDYVAPTLPAIPDKSFIVTGFGAVGDSLTDNTLAIQKAIDAAVKAGGGRVIIPSGVYLCGPLQFASNIDLHIDAGAVLRMLPLDRYPGGIKEGLDFISGNKLHDISITGKGTIDGQGSPWWPYAKTEDAKRPRMVALKDCNRILIEGVKLMNSPKFHLAISGKTSDLTVQKVIIRAPASDDPVNPSHNTDACDVSGQKILIRDCDVSVGDDDFTCGGNTSDVLITNCTYGYGHGVSIGSYTKGGVSNITVESCTFTNTDYGIRIKSDRDRGGVVQNLTYRNLKMTNVGMPILIYAAYNAKEKEYRNLPKLTPAIAATYPSAPLTDLTPAYRNITFKNITATTEEGKRAGLIWGLPESVASGITLDNVTITADRPFGVFFARDVSLVNCKITTKEGENMIEITNAGVTIDGKEVK